MLMGLLAEFVEWFALVALAFGSPALVQHYFSHASATRRKIARSERRVRQLREITERFERLQDEQRSVDARQAALDTPDLEHLGTLRQLCADLAARATAERRAPGSTTLAHDIEALLDAAASLGNEYTRSASLGHILELYVHAGLHRAGQEPRPLGDRCHAVRDRLHQDPLLAPVLRRDGPALLLMRASAPAPAGGEASAPSPEPKSAD